MAPDVQEEATENLAKLTERERVCLREVMLHKTSKEIAQDLGISPHTVDQRLRVAIRKLGVTTRFEAARTLYESEQKTYQRDVYQSDGVVETPIPSLPIEPRQTDDPIASTKEEIESQPEGALPEAQEDANPLRFSKSGQDGEGRKRNDLGIIQRLAWTLALTCLLIIAFGTLLASFQALIAIMNG